MGKIIDVETALELFYESSKKQAEATEQGDYKTGNKNYDNILKAITFLKKENAIRNLEAYLSSPFVGNRLWSAFYLLNINEKEAVKVLKEIVKSSNIHSLTAETTLKEWYGGNLDI